MPAVRPCPCLSGNPYAECCAPFHEGAATPPTAERLMRSRYSAYVVRDAAYLLATWHSSTRPASLDLDDRRWIGLEILSRTGGGMLDATGTVEFVATWRGGAQHENSTFTRENGRWVYVDALRPHAR